MKTKHWIPLTNYKALGLTKEAQYEIYVEIADGVSQEYIITNDVIPYGEFRGLEGYIV